MATKTPVKRLKTARIPKPPKVEAAPKELLTKKDCLYSLGKERVTKDTKLQPQARIIIDIVSEHGPIRREDLLIKMDERIKSVQPAKKIISYYQSILEKDGFLVFQNPNR